MTARYTENLSNNSGGNEQDAMVVSGSITYVIEFLRYAING
jgi:hypothetical protein